MSSTVAGPEMTIRDGTVADTERILALVKLSLGEGLIPRDPDFWKWKHHQNPFGESPILLAEAEGEIVGLRVFMRWAWQANGLPVPAVRAVDTATHPAWQGKGIFRRLTLALVERMRSEGVAFVFNTPNSQSRPGYLKMGWGAVGRLDLWIRPQRPLRIARLLAARARGAGGDASPPMSVGSSSAQSLEELLAPRSELETWLRANSVPGTDPRLTVCRGPDYLRWRYAAIPGFRYHALAEIDGVEGALVVFRSKAQGALTELRVCELVLGPGGRSRRIARSLLAKLRQGSEADYLAAMAARGTAEQRTLLRAGFVPAPRLGPILTVFPLNSMPGGLDPLRRGSWRASLGDMELF